MIKAQHFREIEQPTENELYVVQGVLRTASRVGQRALEGIDANP